MLRYKFRVIHLPTDRMFQWTEDESYTISYRRRRKMTNKQAYSWTPWMKRKVHLQNARIIRQLLSEIRHGNGDRGHESLRRMAYAEGVLEAVGRELDRNESEPVKLPPLKALSPILVRQMKAVPDAYGPAIQAAVAPGKDIPTISDVTDFYLGVNPLDPKFIRIYHRNIIYSREALWHLGITTGSVHLESKEHYERSLEVHDLIMEALRNELSPKTSGIPPFSKLEVHVICRLGLDRFFAKELERVVCVVSGRSSQFLIVSTAQAP